RSFLTGGEGRPVENPLVEAPALPPLVTFHHEANFGPALLTSPAARALCDADVAVAVMPGTFARTPLAWASLAHEACGHGLLRAHPDLLPGLIAGVRSLFGGGPVVPGQKSLSDDQALSLLWTCSLEETASDVYGLLNLGPTYALNLAAFLSGVRFADAFKSGG